MKGPKKSKPVGVLTKTFRIIETLQGSTLPLTLKEISDQTSINKSTALRFLSHLETERYVTRDARGAYSVGDKLLQLGARSTFQVQLREAAQEPLRESGESRRRQSISEFSTGSRSSTWIAWRARRVFAWWPMLGPAPWPIGRLSARPCWRTCPPRGGMQ